MSTGFICEANGCRQWAKDQKAGGYCELHAATQARLEEMSPVKSGPSVSIEDLSRKQKRALNRRANRCRKLF